MQTRDSGFTSIATVAMGIVRPRRAGYMLCVVAALLSLQPAEAQENGGALTKAEQSQIVNIMNRVDEKIKAAFKGQEALEAAMTRELQAISAMRDPAQQKTAGAAYRSKHLDSYRKILNRAGVDIPSVAREIQGVARRFNVSATQDQQLVGTFIHTSSTRLAAPSRTSREIDEFVDARERSCANIAGGEVTVTSSTIAAGSNAVVAGGCESSGTKSAAVEVPAGARSAHLSASADLFADALVVGIGGSASASAGAFFRVDESAQQSGVSIIAIAPILWVASEEESLDSSSINVEVAPGSNRTVRFHAHSLVFAAIGGGGSSATTKRIKASLTVVQ